MCGRTKFGKKTRDLEDIKFCWAITFCSKATYYATENDEDICENCAEDVPRLLEKFHFHAPVQAVSKARCISCNQRIHLTTKVIDCVQCATIALSEMRKEQEEFNNRHQQGALYRTTRVFYSREGKLYFVTDDDQDGVHTTMYCFDARKQFHFLRYKQCEE